MSHDIDLLTLERFERALAGDAAALASLSNDEREAVVLAGRLPAFFASRRSAGWSLGPMARSALLASATIALAAGLSSVVLANLDFRKLPWVVPLADRVDFGATRSIATLPPAVSQEQALAQAPFRAVRPPFVPSDFSPVDGLLSSGPGAPTLILRYVGPRGAINIYQLPRSTSDMNMRMAVPESAATEIPIGGGTAVFARGAWRQRGQDTVWDPTAPGRTLVLASDQLVFRIEWFADSLQIQEATEIAAALMKAGASP